MMRILCPLKIYFHQDGLVWGLRQAGCDVRVLDGQPLRYAHLAGHLEEFRPDLILTYGWWEEHFLLDDLERALMEYRRPHVCWASDDPTHHERISLPLARLADLVLTTVEELIPVYRRLGKKTAHLQFACNPEIHRRIDPVGADRHDIVLIANNYSRYDFMYPTYRTVCMETIIRPLTLGRFDLKVYGGEWDNAAHPFHIPAAYAGPAVPYRDQAAYYAAAKIVLGIQTECHWRTQTSCRPFEVMGCGAFHLAPATRAMRHLFASGRHLALSRSAAETVELARYYLDHREERERIAAAGQLEVYGKHTYIHRARELLALAKELL